MTPPPTLIDRATRFAWFRRDWTRRLVLLALLLLLALLAVFPTPYRALVKLAPPATSTNALGPVLGQLGGNYVQLMGGGLSVELDLIIARSNDVTRDVAVRLGLAQRRDDEERLRRAVVRLEDDVTVRSLRGGILQIETKNWDPEWSLKLVRAYSESLRTRLSRLSREQVAYKRNLLEERLADATNRLRMAEGALSQFRRSQNLPAPEAQLAQSVSTLTALEGAIQAKEVALNTALQFQTPDNYDVKRIQAELAVLRRQLTEARTTQRSMGSPTATALSDITVRYANLNRDLGFAQTLYNSYVTYLEGSAIEELATEFKLVELETAHLDPDRQFNTIPLVLLIIVVLLFLASELFVIAPAAGATGERTVSNRRLAEQA